MQMQDARDFYGVPASPRPRSSASQARESGSPPAGADRDHISPSVAAAAAERRPRHAARRRLQLDADADGRGNITSAVPSSQEGSSGQLMWHGAMPPALRTAHANLGCGIPMGSPLRPAEHAADTSPFASAARKQLPDGLRHRSGARAAERQRTAAQGYNGGQILLTGSEALLPSLYPGDTSTATAQVSASASVQDVTTNSNAAPSAPAAAALTGSGIAGGSDTSRRPAAQSWHLLDSSSGSVHAGVGGAETPLDRSVFLDAGSVGAESPGSSDAEGPTGEFAGTPWKTIDALVPRSERLADNHARHASIVQRALTLCGHRRLAAAAE